VEFDPRHFVALDSKKLQAQRSDVSVEFLKKTPSAKPEACADIVDALLIAQYYVELVSEFC
jgi:hypothetical protein